jgi:ABC-2 type transport system permease protein
MAITEYLGGLVLSSIATSAVGLTVMLLLATLVFGLSYAGYGAAVMIFLLVLFLFGIALGIVASGLVLWLGPAAEWFVWPIPALISPFAGVFYPIHTLPPWMQGVARAMPPSYVFESMRSIVRGGSAQVSMLLIGGGLAAGYILLACWIFTRIYRFTVRTGLLARYSAESPG